MNEIKKFLRYSIPGLVSFIIFIVVFILSNNILLRFPDTIDYLKNNDFNFLGIIIGSFVAFGTLGYIFSNIYFPIIWYFQCITMNYLKWIIDNKEFIKIYTIIENKKYMIDVEKHLNKRDALLISNIFWDRNLDNIFKYHKDFDDKLIDINHSVGTSFVGITIMYLIWIIDHYYFADTINYNLAKEISFHIIWFIPLLCFRWNFIITKKKLETIANSLFSELIFLNHPKDTEIFYYIRNRKKRAKIKDISNQRKTTQNND